MVYLVIIVVIAGAGIGRLWWIQRRHATSLSRVDGFRSSLERLSGQQPIQRSGAVPATDGSIATGRYELPSSISVTDGSIASSESSAATGRSSGSSRGSSSGSHRRTGSDPYLEPLNPERRAAAKRRLEARRRGATRSDLRSR